MDDKTELSGNIMKAQIDEYSDLVQKQEFLPPTKKNNYVKNKLNPKELNISLLSHRLLDYQMNFNK